MLGELGVPEQPLLSELRRLILYSQDLLDYLCQGSDLVAVIGSGETDQKEIADPLGDQGIIGAELGDGLRSLCGLTHQLRQEGIG